MKSFLKFCCRIYFVYQTNVFQVILLVAQGISNFSFLANPAYVICAKVYVRLFFCNVLLTVENAFYVQDCLYLVQTTYFYFMILKFIILWFLFQKIFKFLLNVQLGSNLLCQF